MLLKIKYILLIFVGFFVLCGNTYAEKFSYYYGDGCSYCHEVSLFFKKYDIEKKFNIDKKESYFIKENREEFLKLGQELGIALNKLGVPFLYEHDSKQYYNGSEEIKSLFLGKINQNNIQSTPIEPPENNTSKEKGFFKFLMILFPAAISDSINPCAFAVLFILLSSILSQSKNKKRTLYAGLLFCLSIFISYFLMGIGVYKVINSSGQIFYVKLVVGILGILVGLANIKDYFWYGKLFIMEVPFSWRPKMKKFLQGVTSPLGAFFIGFLISLFLLPCTSGPYLTILGYLAAESAELNMLGYIYMIIYNLIFIIPMIVITFLVTCGVKDIAELKEYKELYSDKIHLVVGILMLGLGLFILGELFIG